MNDYVRDAVKDKLENMIGYQDDSCSYEYGNIVGVYGGVGPYLADDSFDLDVVIPDDDDWDEDALMENVKGVEVRVEPEGELIVSREDGSLRVRGTFHVEQVW